MRFSVTEEEEAHLVASRTAAIWLHLCIEKEDSGGEVARRKSLLSVRKQKYGYFLS